MVTTSDFALSQLANSNGDLPNIQMTVHRDQTMQGPTPPMVTYVDVLHNADDQSEAKSEQTQMTIKSLV